MGTLLMLQVFPKKTPKFSFDVYAQNVKESQFFVNLKLSAEEHSLCWETASLCSKIWRNFKKHT